LAHLCAQFAHKTDNINKNVVSTMAETGFLPVNQDVDTAEVMPLVFPGSTEPFYEQQPLFVENLQGYVHFGSFVKMTIPAQNSDVGIEVVVRLIRRRQSSGHIIVECYKPIKRSSAVLGSAINLVVELYQSSTGWMVLHLEKYIKSIVFVFSPSIFEELANEWSIGMKNLFFVKKKSILVDELDVGNFVDLEKKVSPFPSQAPISKYVTCLPHEIWNGLEQMHRMMSSIMNRRAESQGEYCSASEKQFFGCLAAPNSFAQLSRQSRMVVKLLETSSSIAHTDPCGLSRKKSKYTTDALFVRFETKEQLEILKNILGSTVTCGLRKMAPKSGESKHLLTNDAINIVVGAEEEEIPYRRRTARRGVDFLITTTYVKVVVRYEKYLYKRLRNGDIIACPDDNLVQMIRCYRDKDLGSNDENENPSKVEVGDYFSYNDEFCKVVAVTDAYVEVSVVSPPANKGETRKLSYNDPNFLKFIDEI
jgi:hypothetical protein